MGDYVWWVSGGKGLNNWWCGICGENYDWKLPKQALGVVQTGESGNQAKVFKAHAVPQDLTIGGAGSVEKTMIGSYQNRLLVWCRQAKVVTRPRSSKRMQYLRAYVGS